MDILNFISWIKGGRTVTTVDPAQTLLPVGLKDSRRDDGYLAGAISVEDLVTQIVPEPAYKVYTALLTQSGSDGSFVNVIEEDLIIGATYFIKVSNGGDFTNVGAPNNNINTYFVATGTTPNSWGSSILSYCSSAPVVIVLENSLGVEPTYRYSDVGEYIINTVMSFNFNKIAFIFGNGGFAVNPDIASYEGGNEMFFFTPNDNQLYNYPIEIRVYN